MKKKCFASALNTKARTPFVNIIIKLHCSLFATSLLVALMGWHWPCFQHNFNTHFLFVHFPNSFSSSKIVCVCYVPCIFFFIFSSCCYQMCNVISIQWFPFNSFHLIQFGKIRMGSVGWLVCRSFALCVCSFAS